MTVTKVPLRRRATSSESSRFLYTSGQPIWSSDHRQDDEDGKGDDKNYRHDQMPRHSLKTSSVISNRAKVMAAVEAAAV
jgi:hypothetical protein